MIIEDFMIPSVDTMKWIYRIEEVREKIQGTTTFSKDECCAIVRNAQHDAAPIYLLDATYRLRPEDIWREGDSPRILQKRLMINRVLFPAEKPPKQLPGGFKKVIIENTIAWYCSDSAILIMYYNRRTEKWMRLLEEEI